MSPSLSFQWVFLVMATITLHVCSSDRDHIQMDNHSNSHHRMKIYEPLHIEENQHQTAETSSHLYKIKEIRHNALQNEEMTDNASLDAFKTKPPRAHNIHYAKHTFYALLIIFIANALCLIYYVFGRDCIHRLKMKRSNQGIYSNTPPQFDENEIDRMILEIEDVKVSQINSHHLELQLV